MSQDGSSTGPRCPICGRPTERRWRPFCSRRCADVDLGRWLRGTYAVPIPTLTPRNDPAPRSRITHPAA
jgi:uncharacterized protein